MFGIGVLKGMAVTLREFVNTYVDDIKKIPSRYAAGRDVLDQSQDSKAQEGLFTIQYPEERRKLPERFRYIPMLIYEAETGEDRCTACGICAKVCPPQCIWIVRDRDANGKPITRPAEFDIDATICMNCGLCAEFCPFDAIKMNHDFEIAAFERMPELIFTVKELRVPTTYYATLYPQAWADEQAEREAKAKEAAAKAAAKPAPAAKPAAPQAAATATAPAVAAPAPAAAPAGGRPSPEELERRRAEARARKAAAEGAAGSGAAGSGAAGSGAAEGPALAAPAEIPAPVAAAQPAPAAPAPTSGGRLTPEELEKRRAEARARKAARDAEAAAKGDDQG